MASNPNLKNKRMALGVFSKNAKSGARNRWCPNCHRYSALGQAFGSTRICRYCGFVSTSEVERKDARKAWEASQQLAAPGHPAVAADEDHE